MKKLICLITYCCFALVDANGNDYMSNGGGIDKKEGISSLKEQEFTLLKYNDQTHIESIASLIQLTNSSLTVTSESLRDIESSPKTSILQLDIYDGSNLSILIKQSIDYILSGENSSFNGLLNKIENDKELHTLINKLRELLAQQETYTRIDFEDESYFKIYTDVLSSISDIVTKIEANTQFANEDTYFLDFMKLSKKFIELAFVRYNTEKILSKIRASLEGIQGVTSSTSASLSVNIPVPIPGMTANLDLFATGNSYGSTGLSFYTVTKTKGTKAGITFNILPAKISGKISLEDAAVSLFYSLEAYMDFLNSSSVPDLNKLQAKIQGMDGALKDRKELQNREKELLANNGMFERYLKMFHALPQTGVSLIWIDITKAKALDKAKEITVGSEISANVAVPLSSLGLTLKASTGTKTYIKGTPLLSMINDDCSVIDGMGLEDLKELIGSKNDLSKIIGDSNLLLGMLQSYTFALERLAVTSSSSEKQAYEKKKHSCEDVLLPKGSTGREGVLKAAILTSAVLRKDAGNDQNLIRRFRKIYVQLCNLSKLCEFSKNKSGVRKFFGYGTKADTESDVKANINSLQATFTAQAPKVGNISATAIRKTIKGSPLLQEDGKYITFKFTLPIYSTGVVGMAIMREKFKSVFAAASDKKIPINFDDFSAVAKAFGITKGMTTAANVLIPANSPVGVSAYGSSDFTFVWRYVDPLKDISGIIPLPEQKLLRNENGCWALDFIVASTTLNGAINTSSNIIDLPVSLKLSASMGKLAKRTGSNTLNDLLSKVNALSLGISDSKSGESTAIDSLLKGQSGQMLKIFKKIAKMNSNAAFELQMLYNDMLKNSKNSGEKREIEQLFFDFLTACKNINNISSSSPNEEEQVDSGEAEVAELTGEETANDKEDYINMEQYKTAFNLFRKILDKQYVLVFKPYYDNKFAGTTENNSVSSNESINAFEGITADAR